MSEVTGNSSPGTGSEGLEQKVIDAIRCVYDPEIPVNLYDLGLIYDISLGGEGAVSIKMTLTAPFCPVAGEMPIMVERAVLTVEEVDVVDVELVWNPPWNPDMMSEAARLELGM